MASAFSNTLWALFGWVFLWPLTFLVPRDTRSFVVIGRDGGKFLDNAKHFFVTLRRSSAERLRLTFLTDHAAIADALRKAACRVAPLSGFRGRWELVRCGTVVVDSVDWSSKGRFALLRGARVVQLWHGVPLKRIELMVAERIAANLSPFARISFWGYRWFTGRHVKVTALVSTSTLVAQQAMMRCFRADHWPATGYPRNDVLIGEELRKDPLMRLNVDQGADSAALFGRMAGKRTLLYAPTFRKHFRDPFSSGVIDLLSLDALAERQGLTILIKLHPWMRRPDADGRALRNIVFVSPDSDIYPVLPDVDILLTDYSSIFFDYLLLDRPIVFFCHDLAEYLEEDRGFIFDYESMTPGPKVTSLNALEKELANLSAGLDPWRERRNKVRAMVFDHDAGSSVERLMAYLRDHP